MCFKIKALLFMAIPFICSYPLGKIVSFVFSSGLVQRAKIYIQNIVEVGIKFTFISFCIEVHSLFSVDPLLLGFCGSIWYWIVCISLKRMSIMETKLVKISFSLCLLFYMKNHQPQLKHLLVNICSQTHTHINVIVYGCGKKFDGPKANETFQVNKI